MKTSIKKLNSVNPGFWVMACNGIYIAKQSISGINMTDKKVDAEKWTYADTQSCKIEYFKPQKP